MRETIVIIAAALLFGCQSEPTVVSEQKPSEVDIEKQLEAERRKDSLRLVDELRIEQELLELKKQGVVGKWDCDFSGYESIITFYEKTGKFTAEIMFTKSGMKTKTEKLQKNGARYEIVGSTASEYYTINSDGGLSILDKQGHFADAINIMPGAPKIEKEPINIKTVVGENIFSVAGRYSKSHPRTLTGTNNKTWIVAYDDIAVKFKVNKVSMNIETAEHLN